MTYIILFLCVKGIVMTLNNYLKQFKNVCWYPSAERDVSPIVCLSKESLKLYDIPEDKIPNCFIFTDYETFIDPDMVLSIKKFEMMFENTKYPATVSNVQELKRLDIGFDSEMVAFDKSQDYGRVFTADITVFHQKYGKISAKLVYIIAENASFAFDFLLKKKIKVKYLVHANYGYGFGGGISNGRFLMHILKELHTEYFASDIDKYVDDDIAYKYLNEKQLNTHPELIEVDNLYERFRWYGYAPVILYQVK